MEIPHEVTPRRDTGLFNAKLGVWLFLASEVMLFGGLFSAYVFLRVGAQDGVDNPWPWGINVHKDFVWLGFLNTLVLILSSVWVVFAWVSLKERNWRRFQLYMYGVVACAAIFMCVKMVEYNSKLNHHHGIKLTDNSVMEGSIVDGTENILFEAEEFSFSFPKSGLPGFLKDIEGDVAGFTATYTEIDKKTLEEVTRTEELASVGEVERWFVKKRSDKSRELALVRKRYRAELAADPSAKRAQLDTSATLVAKEPVRIDARFRQVVNYSDTSLSYKDGASLEGKLIRDEVEFVVHEVDLQLVLPQNQRDSLVWEVIGDEHAKKQFFDAQAEEYKDLEEYFGDKPIPEKHLRGYVLNLQDVHVGGHHDAGHGEHEEHGDHGDEAGHGEAESTGGEAPTGSPEPKASEGHGEGAHADTGDGGHEDHGHGATIAVPRDQIKFMGNHGPRYGNYYAIYFTMTALHGLHVVGGALVLLFMVVFGKKLYLKNPEHLANRVEVGGLFWHFVDLVWIFLFPLFYLL